MLNTNQTEHCCVKKQKHGEEEEEEEKEEEEPSWRDKPLQTVGLSCKQTEEELMLRNPTGG